LTTIRIARPDEYDRVGELTIAAYQSLPVDHLFGGYDEEILATAERAKDSDILVAVEHDLVLGSVTFVGDPASRWREWTEPEEVQFRLLAVDPAARGQGIGEALVHACVERAGDSPIIIHTTQWMEAARRMYERLGFVRRPDRDVPYEVWNEGDRFSPPPAWAGRAFLAYSFTASQ
jgi:ribosomal protein S18 acetylase RimI-like enzyme